MACRFINRYKHLNTDIQDQNRTTIPVWRAYNSLNTSRDLNKSISDKGHALPIINSSASDWKTLVTVLENLYDLNKIACPDSGKAKVTFDMDLYKRALKLEHIDPQHYGGKWWLAPGPFHTSKCAVRCLGKTIEKSGINDL